MIDVFKNGLRVLYADEMSSSISVVGCFTLSRENTDVYKETQILFSFLCAEKPLKGPWLPGGIFRPVYGINAKPAS